MVHGLRRPGCVIVPELSRSNAYDIIITIMSDTLPRRVPAKIVFVGGGRSFLFVFIISPRLAAVVLVVVRVRLT